MLKFVFFILMLLSSLINYAQAPDWVWSKGLFGSGFDKSHTIELDKSSNVIVTGAFSSNTLTLGSTTLSNIGSYDVFIAKYDSSGNDIWALSIGGSGEDESWDIISDYDNNIIVTGWFKSSDFYIGSDTILHNTGTGTMFIVKYDSLGNFLWAHNSIGNGREWGRALGVDENNKIYLGGNFIDGNISIGGTTYINQGSYDMFIVKYNSNGQMIGSIHKGTSGLDLLRNMAISPYYGNIHIIGDFESNSITFDSITLNNNSPGIRDNFVVKYNSSGNVIWAKHIGGAGLELGCFIAVDWKENVYVTGQYESNICNFNTLNTYNTTSSRDIYLAKYDFMGNIGWVTSMNGSNDDMVYSITSDMDDGVYICGWFDSYNLNVGTDILTSNGANDIFIAMFDYQGNYYWTKQCGNNQDDFAECLISDANGNLYVTGNFNSTSIDFDAFTLNNTGSYDIFISKLATNDSLLNINSNSKKSKLNLYPNPTTGLITINNEKLKIKNVAVFDIYGKEVLMQDVTLRDSKCELDLSQQAKGIYIIKVTTDRGVAVEKIVLE